MKKILLSVVLATTLALTSCQFDDSALWSKLDEYGQSIKDHEQRISALEELCKQMNTNIEALQTLVDALEKRDYVTNVSEVRSNGEVIGYTISFAYSDTITIYHGQDGKDGANGADGKDGYTPQIGVMKDTDNIYYWTLDGEWLLDGKGNKIKAVGTDGADGKDGQDGANGTDGKDGQNGTNGSDGKDGQDGTNGTDGKDGADGVTPQLKIENDYWYVSYDNGATWVQLGKASGEDGKDGQDGNDGADGSDGADGEDGDSIFKSVTQDDEYVYFNLADGTMITLPKHDKENIQFEDLQVKAICCKNWDTNNDGELSYAEAAAVTTCENMIEQFYNNTNILAFTELQYFTGLTSSPDFSGSSIWKVTLPKQITAIGGFTGCNLKDIIIPDNVDIPAYAFNQTTIKGSIVIGKGVSVNKAGYGANYAFVDCIAKELVVNCNIYCNLDPHNAGVTNFDYGWFHDNYFEKITIGNNVSTIGEAAFYQSRAVEELYIPDSVTEIGRYAFLNCYSLKKVTISSNIKSIGANAFEGCECLTEVYCKSINPPKNSLWIFSRCPSDLKIYVSRTSLEAYKTAPNWKEYASNIEPYDFE